MTADFPNRFSSYLCPLNFFVLCSFLVPFWYIFNLFSEFF